MILAILLAVSLLLNVGLGFACYRLSRKLLAFDDLFEALSWDIDKNIEFFKKLLETPTFTATPEIVEAHNSMRIIAIRLNEFVLQMGELTNKEQMHKEKSSNPPVVV
jgi:hypothetical protein